MSTELAGTTRTSAQDAHKFATDVLTSAGVPKDNAGIVADSLVLADLRGVDTHGINRLPGYIARVRAGST